MGTNDIHGAFFPQKVNINNNIYDYGGLIYMGNYITNLREEWGNRFIWLDSGDQFQGGLESKISYGDIMTDFFNIMEINGSTIGNHEWDFKIDFLINRTSKAKFKYICSNIKNITTNNNIFLPNQISTSILNIDKIKIGIIGLTTITTKISNKAKVENIEFLPYVEIIKEKSLELKKNGADVIVLLLHLGVECEIDIEIKLKLGLYDKVSKFDECRKNDELYELLSQFNDDNKYFDVIVSGHTHETVHQWIKGYPVISNIDKGKYFNLMYLYFNKNGDKYTFLKDKTIIEGPIPICEKIFEKTLKCEIGNSDEIKNWGNLNNFKFHDKIIKKEEKLINLSKKWEEKIEKFNSEILTSTDKKMEHIYFNESILSNFYTDAYRKTFVQETTFTLISSMQFHLSISMLEQIFTDQRNDSYMANELQIRNKNLFSFLFFCLVFSFKGILPSHGLLSSIQFICIFISISIFYKYMNNKIELYLTNVQKNNSQFTGRNFINNLPFFIFIYLGINYILQLSQLMLDNKLYESYMTMICIIFKEVGKYLVVLLMIMIFNTFNKYVKTNEHSYTSQPIKLEEKKKVVQVYKDEDESVQF